MSQPRIWIHSAAVCVAVLCVSWLPLSTSAWQEKKETKDEFARLFHGNMLQDKDWHYFFSDNAANGSIQNQKTFTLLGKDPQCTLTISGKPNGYLRTKEKFTNYILHLKWRYTKDPNGNSGVLLHIQEPDKVWPQCFQVQMQNAEAGAIFPLTGAKSSNRQPPPETKIAVPVKEWNEWEITSLDGKISLKIKKGDKWIAVGEITGCEPASGHIGFQSEGAEVEFREVKLKILPAEKPETGDTSDTSE